MMGSSPAAADASPFHSLAQEASVGGENFGEGRAGLRSLSSAVERQIFFGVSLRVSAVYWDSFGLHMLDLELKAERALACPCVAELRDGPCGKAFSEAFVCFVKSTAEHKGSDCVDSFLTMQVCMLENPDAFASRKVHQKTIP